MQYSGTVYECAYFKYAQVPSVLLSDHIITDDSAIRADIPTSPKNN